MSFDHIEHSQRQNVTETLERQQVEQDSKRFLLRSAPRPGASLALAALGVALPPTLRQIADV